MSAPPVCSSESSPMQDRPACMGKPEGDTPPRGRAVASAVRRDPAPSPPSAHKRRNETCDEPAAKRALTNGSEAVPDFMDLSDRAAWPSLDGSPGAPARDGPSQGSSITDQPEQHADENGFAHLLLEGIPPVDLSDQATKENTWRNIPARCRPKIADKLATLSRERPAEANAHVTTATIATFAIKHGSNFITFSKF